jgi:hypothetical protein
MNRRIIGIPLWGYGVIAVGAFIGLSVQRAASNGAYWRSTPVDDSAAAFIGDTATVVSNIVTAGSGGVMPDDYATIGQNPSAGVIS